MLHRTQEVQTSDGLEVSSLLLVKEVETLLVHQLTGDLKGNLVTPSVDSRHADIIHEDAQTPVSKRLVLSSLLLNFRLNRLLEVVGLRVVREVNSLERLLRWELHGVHQDDRGLRSSRSSNEESALASSLFTYLRSEVSQSSHLLNDIVRSCRIWRWDEQLREDELLWLLPGRHLPSLPTLRGWVDEILKDGLLIALCFVSNWRQWRTNLLKNLLMELLSLISLEETTHSPSVRIGPNLLEKVKLDSLIVFLVLLEACSEQVEHLSDSDNLWRVHHILEVLAKEVEDGLLLWIGRSGIVEGLVLEELLDEVWNPLGLVRIALSDLLGSVLPIVAPGGEKRLPVEISVRNVDDTVTRHSSWGGVSQVIDFTSHLCGVRHWDTLSVSQSKDLVVIEHGVEVLNPDGVDGSVTLNPVVELVSLHVDLLPDLGVDSLFPLSETIHGSEHLDTLDGLGVHLGNDELDLLSALGKSLGQRLIDGGLTATGISDDHESVTGEVSLIELNELEDEVILLNEVLLGEAFVNVLLNLWMRRSLNEARNIWEDITNELSEE